MRNFLFAYFFLASIASYGQAKTTVYFNSSESILTASARKKLDSLALVLKSKNGYHLALSGYCDSTGTPAVNAVLRKERVANVFNYLKNHGISAGLMTQVKFPESYVSAMGTGPILNARMRRVEILFETESIAYAPLSRDDHSVSIAELEVGQKLVLKNLNFVLAEARLLRESWPTLDTLLECMRAHPTLEIKLSGHVCCGPAMKLSIARAKTVYDYLVNNGINASRITYEGLSNTVPLLPNDGKDSIAANINRRVEVTIMKK